MKKLADIAKQLDNAMRTGKPIAQFTDKDTLSVEDAYIVQSLLLSYRQQRGEQRSGYKMGLTSRAKMQQVGVDDVIAGQLTDVMLVEDGGSVNLRKGIHPRVEPEIAFLIGKRVPERASVAQAMAAIDGICPAIEIIDSRYRDFQFALGDVIADNTSASHYVLGPLSSPHIDYANLGMVLEKDGHTVAVGSSAAILGHPARAIVAAARMLGKQGMALAEGDILLAGAATEAVPIGKSSSVRTIVHRLGSVSFTVG